MAGERNAPPREEVVRDSLRFSLAQLGPRVKKWRIAFVCLALLLLVFGSWRGFVWVRDNTEWLPQKETVVTPVSIRDVDQLLVQLSDMRSAAIFDVALSDEITGFRLELELWEGGTLTKSWLLLAGSGRIEGIEGMRHQKIGLSAAAIVLIGSIVSMSVCADQQNGREPAAGTVGYALKLNTASVQPGIEIANNGLRIRRGAQHQHTEQQAEKPRFHTSTSPWIDCVCMGFGKDNFQYLYIYYYMRKNMESQCCIHFKTKGNCRATIHIGQ